MNVLLINTSPDEYNLGLAKAANYWRSTRRASVSYAQSVPTLFPSHFRCCLDLRDILGKEVAVDGPATFGVQKQIQAATGLKPQTTTPDPRFERQPGTDQAVFSHAAALLRIALLDSPAST